jgi:hypothetical protein
MAQVPAKQLPDDIVDRVAKEVAAQVVAHITTMYPAAAEAVAWNSASRSIQGVVRNAMSEAGHAAETGDIDKCLAQMRSRRLAWVASWRKFQQTS